MERQTEANGTACPVERRINEQIERGMEWEVDRSLDWDTVQIQPGQCKLWWADSAKTRPQNQHRIPHISKHPYRITQTREHIPEGPTQRPYLKHLPIDLVAQINPIAWTGAWRGLEPRTALDRQTEGRNPQAETGPWGNQGNPKAERHPWEVPADGRAEAGLDRLAGGRAGHAEEGAEEGSEGAAGDHDEAVWTGRGAWGACAGEAEGGGIGGGETEEGGVGGWVEFE